MSTFEEQTERFGGRCKWLECDCYCHMSDCTLNKARRSVMMDRVAQLGLKHTEFVYSLYSDYCNGRKCDYRCFDGSEKPKGFDFVIIDGIEYTKTESEAIAIATEELKDDVKVRELYMKGRGIYIENRRAEIAKMTETLDAIEKEVE